MNREALDRGCERGILGLVLAILVFGPLATGAVRPLPFLIIQGLTLGVMVLWGLRLWLGERSRLLWPPICWVVVLFTGYAIARYLTCEIEYVGRQELIRILVYAFLFFAILNNLHRQEYAQIISYTMVFLALAISGYAIYQFVTGSDRVWHFHTPYKGRGCGTYICPNHLGGFLEVLLPLALAYTLAGRGKPLTKILLGYAALVMLAGIGVTVSRGSWVAAGFALLVFFGILALHRNYRLPSLVMMLFLVGAGLVFLPKTAFFTNRVKAGVDAGKNLEVDVRFQLWQATVRMWRDHTWLGVGPGHFDHRFRAYRPVEVQLRPDRAHNEYLNTLADWGVVGMALVAAALGVLFVGVLRTWKHVRRSENEFKTNQSNKFAFVVGASLGLLALLIHSAVDFNMQIPANAILAISLMALLSSHLRFATESYWVRVGTGLRIVASGVLLAGVAYLGWQEVRLGREYVWRERAASQPIFSREQAAALQKAFAIEPSNFETTYALGEAYRVQSSEGGENYRELAEQAMTWFARGTNSNPYDGYNFMRYGWCLDWLGRHAEAEPYFNRADELDPNGYFTAAFVGRHYIETGEYAAARPWFERSLKLQREDNPVADFYLEFANLKLLAAATNQSQTLPK
ncbi:MAG: O-antigen ligase family protein [Verrucomicrobia bacterium]|jgi:O-antigen ligase|nr:O-antigen ligase family protein [Verrucomicrobiota bacterium]